uniref:Uncharacterized protein n=1 Tax=Ralstonia solanacearum CFBP2957 TaxID=859656 RepID=D8P3R4_RALSL|nr:conserved protein of unknown function [Ralstonia solanacearum CFBP2957]
MFQFGKPPSGFGVSDFFYFAKLDGIQNAHISSFSTTQSR